MDSEVVSTSKSVSQSHSEITVQVDENVKDEISSVVTNFVVKSCFSSYIVNGKGFREFTSHLLRQGAKNGAKVDVDNLLPKHEELSEHLSVLYDKCSKIVKAELKELGQNGYGITIGLLSEDRLKQSFLAVCIHYVMDGEFKVKYIGLDWMDNYEPTGEEIRSTVSEMLTEFNCDLNEAIVVTVSELRMNSAFQSCNHIYFMDCLINMAVDTSISETPEVKELNTNCIDLVEYFEDSEIYSEMEASEDMSGSPAEWKRLFYRSKFLEQNWEQITAALEENNTMSKIKDISLCFIKEIVKLLKHFEEASKKLENESTATLHLVYVYAHDLKEKNNFTNDDLNAIRKFKERLIFNFNTKVFNNISILHKVAMFLYPPTKELKPFTECDKHIIKNECKKLVKQCAEGKRNEQQPTIDSDEKIDHEIMVYEETDVDISNNLDILKWWNCHKVQFALLYKVSCRVLAAPASNALLDRIFFGKARYLFFEEDCYEVNKEIFLHCNGYANEDSDDKETDSE